MVDSETLERMKSLGIRITRKLTIKFFVAKWILEREKQIEQDPGILYKGRVDQSAVWYDTEPLLIENGIAIHKDTRKTIQNVNVKEICDKLGKRRIELGIVVGDRAQMYFNGKWYNVSIDQIKSLSGKGIVVLIIEKKGMAEILEYYASKYGIALVQTQGYLTENASDLSELVGNYGGNGHVAILTDFDVDGIIIALNAKNVPRIGIDLNTLRKLGIFERYQCPELRAT